MTSAARRVVVVLGYSDRRHGGLHPICDQRLRRAATVATEHDVVVLSGWARVPGTRPEAELMADAWSGPAHRVVVDPDARTTVGNATNAVDDVVQSGAREVVVVTSRWHAPRAAVVFRWCLRHTGATILTATPPDGRLADWLREVPRWLALPVQLSRAAQPSRSVTPDA